MRKHILSANRQEPVEDQIVWLDLETLARVEVSSEAASHPIEAALLPAREGGWRAAEAGEQTIRIVFDTPQWVHRIRLRFREEEQARTQEFVLGWSPDGGAPFEEIVRQQYHFSPPGTVEEVEDYRVELKTVKALELKIRPELGAGGIFASLARMQIA